MNEKIKENHVVHGLCFLFIDHSKSNQTSQSIRYNKIIKLQLLI